MAIQLKSSVNTSLICEQFIVIIIIILQIIINLQHIL